MGAPTVKVRDKPDPKHDHDPEHYCKVVERMAAEAKRRGIALPKAMMEAMEAWMERTQNMNEHT